MTVSCRLIALTVGRVYDVSLQDLYSDSRERRLIIPRQMGWALARHLTGRSLPEIGRHMGDRDHTTVLHGVRKIAELVETDDDLARQYSGLIDSISRIAELPAPANGGIRFFDHDPVETARRIMATPLATVAPTLDEIKSLAMGVLHFEEELARHIAECLPPRPTTRYVLARRPADAELSEAGARVVKTWATYRESILSGFDTINSRRAFEGALKTLQTTIERT